MAIDVAYTKKTHKWVGIFLRFPSELVDVVNASLRTWHLPDIIIKERKGENPNLHCLDCYFPLDESVDKIIRAFDFNLRVFESELSLELPIDVEVRVFLKELTPWEPKQSPILVRVTEHIVVKSPSTQYIPSAREVVIEIRSSLAFGDGTHVTTMFCLKALEDLFRQKLAARPRKEGRVLDVGTGTGILAIAAAKLGAKEVMAVDINADAITEAKRNVDCNQLTKTIAISCLSVEDIDEIFHVVLANLVPTMLSRSGIVFSRIVEPGGFLIISGMLAHNDITLSAYQNLGFRVLKDYTDGKWAGAILQYLP